MANIMNLTRVTNKPSRNGFDLSRKINFTCKVGELLPVWTMPVLPTDDIKINLQNFIRTQSLNQAAFARMRGYYDFYFVPYQQLWNQFNTSITQMNTNLQNAQGPVMSDNKPLSGQLPFFSCEQVAKYIISLGQKKDAFGFFRSTQTCRLLEMLGYGDFRPYQLPFFSCEQVAKYIISLGQKKDAFGFFRSTQTCRLLEMLGYGDFRPYDPNGSQKWTWDNHPMLNNLALSPFPLLAYHKIYADYNRYTQWEKTNPSTFNLNYIKGSNDLNLDLSVSGFTDTFNMFDIRYSNWQKDLFHGVLPVAQYGEASIVPIDSSIQQDLSLLNTGNAFTLSYLRAMSASNSAEPLSIENRHGNSGPFRIGPQIGSSANVQPTKLGDAGTKSDLFNVVPQNVSVTSSLSILALRRAEAAQKWKEVSLAAEEDYPQQIGAHWGEKPSDFLSGMCRYLGGITSNLDINAITNTNLADNNAALQRATGTLASNGNINFQAAGQFGIIMCVFRALPIIDYTTTGVDFSCTLTDVTDFPIPEFDRIGMEAGQFGIIMCVFRALPIIDYTTTGVDFSCTLTDVTDFPIPEFDRIGMESVPVCRALNPALETPSSPPIKADAYFGYAPRYVDWKTAVDVSRGEFTNTLESFVMKFNDDDLLAADSVDFPDNPNVEADSVKAGFFKVNPHVVDTLFAVDADKADHLLCSTFFDVKVVRSLDTNGLPY